MSDTALRADEAADGAGVMRLSDVIAALSYALDMTEGQPPGHCVRCAWIGVQVGQHLGLDSQALSDLYYTLLLKDAGCSSNAARLWELYGGDERLVKRAYKTVDSESFRQLGLFVLRHAGPGESLRQRVRRVLDMATYGDELATELVQTRCERGASIVRRLGFSEAVAAGVLALDEHWNGKGRPLGRAGQAIPVEARIALLAQVVDVFHTVGGPKAACAEARRRTGTWFDPTVVRALLAVSSDPAFWEGLVDSDIDARVAALEPVAAVVMIDEARLDTIAEAFADVIDAKSSFTSGHSRRVMHYAESIGVELGFNSRQLRWLRRAALLHDLGKLGVSNSILDKPGKLDEDEWIAIKRHAEMSEAILRRISVFRDLAPVAGAHHERPDGTGYPRRLRGDDIPLEARIIAVADVFDAITAERPYRGPMPLAQAQALMERDRGTAIDAECFDALKRRVVPSFLESSGIPADVPGGP